MPDPNPGTVQSSQSLRDVSWDHRGPSRANGGACLVQRPRPEVLLPCLCSRARPRTPHPADLSTVINDMIDGLKASVSRLTTQVSNLKIEAAHLRQELDRAKSLAAFNKAQVLEREREIRTLKGER